MARVKFALDLALMAAVAPASMEQMEEGVQGVVLKANFVSGRLVIHISL